MPNEADEPKANRSTQRRVIAALSVCCAVLLFVSIWALANRNQSTPEGPVYWVALNGDDAAPGTSDAPWATLQKAADSAPPGATVYVHGGHVRTARRHPRLR